MQELLTLQYDNYYSTETPRVKLIVVILQPGPVAILNMRFVATFSLGFFHFIHLWIS